jgi:hypothetical protein
MSTATKLKIVQGAGFSAEEIIAEAMVPLVGADGQQLVARAETLASKTVTLIRSQSDPATLASVTLAIGDQSLKVAFLEAVGHRLLR